MSLVLFEITLENTTDPTVYRIRQYVNDVEAREDPGGYFLSSNDPENVYSFLVNGIIFFLLSGTDVNNKGKSFFYDIARNMTNILFLSDLHLSDETYWYYGMCENGTYWFWCTLV